MARDSKEKPVDATAIFQERRASAGSSPRVLPAPQGERRWLRGPDGSWPPYLVGQQHQPVRVLLVDADAGLRRAVSDAFAADHRVFLAGEAGTFKEALRIINRRQDYDLLMVDVRLPDGHGLDLLQAAKRTHAPVEGIMLSPVEDERQAIKAFQAGASGFLYKHSWFRDFVRAVLEVANGGFATSPVIVRRLASHWNMMAPPVEEADTVHPIALFLTRRERAVLELLATGLAIEEMARNLTISEQTVNSHLRNIYRKLHVHNKAQAIAAARSRGVLPARQLA